MMYESIADFKKTLQVLYLNTKVSKEESFPCDRLTIIDKVRRKEYLFSLSFFEEVGKVT